MARNVKKDVKLSATRISTFLQCKLKYWFNYVDHLPKKSNPVFRLGLAVHEALEYAGEIWMEKDDRDRFTKKEISKIMDMPIDNLRVYLSRARKFVIKQIEDE